MLATPDLPIKTFSVSGGLQLKTWGDLKACQNDWLNLETNGAVGPTFQRHAWQKSWFETLGASQKARPFIVIGYRENIPVMVLPFAIICNKGLNRLVWSGGKHSNFNFGLFSEQVADTLHSEQKRSGLEQAVLDVLTTSNVDLIQLSANPEHWDGFPHVIGSKAINAGMTPAFGLDLTPGFDQLFEAKSRKRMRKKHRWQRRFLESGNHTWRMVETAEPDQFAPFLEAFYAQKSARFNALGIEDIFSQDHTQAFIDALKRSNSQGKDLAPALHFYGLEVDGRLIATYGGGSQNGCFSAYFNSFDEDYLPRLSAGEMLLGEMIRHRCELGDRFLDLGMGDERYKHLWCDIRINYFTYTKSRTFKGQLAAMGATIVADVKRTIRSNETLWASYKKLRKAKKLVA
ncbi:GNAT family N-acetyltransferase [Cohaesibacter gelatinilyticus]|uniref:Acetyltransferase involved in cellulose biosynthesis, CelD/BcsL family n=1 Tax=Cohaesibacter gelatinilyticus TaxID=372072 RepID=A0A285NI89_9HYPH|nr:GNAT family N-acetyltransferase [Cohaesibacter gelatinilyticus]SNZ07371.1 Acetyltransferase involved in cellulose biosynthesis, CelD/BcsL family [Cohaesibacter gelatinilyticus]